MMRSDPGSGVTDMISGILMTAVVSACIVLIGITIIPSAVPVTTPSMDVVVTNTTSAIFLTHNGGDLIRSGEYQILVDGQDKTSAFVKKGAPAGNWGVGDTLEYRLQAGQMPRRILILSTRSGTTQPLRDIHL